MPNNITNINDKAALILKASAAVLEDNQVFGKSVTKADPAQFKGANGYSAGQTVRVNRPFIPQVRDQFDATGNFGDFVEDTVPLTLDVVKSVQLQLSTEELAYELNEADIINRVMKPAMEGIAQHIEAAFMEKAVAGTANTVGTPGSTIFDSNTILDARTKMNKYLAPMNQEGRHLILESQAMQSAVNARKGFLNAQAEISKQYKMGYVGTADSFNWHENQLLPVHTNGNDVTLVNVDGGSQTGSTLNLQGLTANTGTIKKGSVFTIADVYAVNPQTKTAYNFLQQFVATADGTADANGDIAVSISPAIVTSGSLQNVSAAPGNTAVVTFQGAENTSYQQGLAFTKQAYMVCSVPLVLPRSTSVEFAARADVGGYTISMVRAFDPIAYKYITRLDFLGGLAIVRPEHACRIWS